MPIAHQILTGSAEFQSPWEAVGLDEAVIRSAARNHFKFEIQVASELYWNGKQNDYDLSKDFGSLRAPYDNCWLEWSWPSVMIIEGKESPAPQALNCAAITEVADADSGPVLMTHLLMQTPGHPITVTGIADQVDTDKQGSVLKRRWVYPKHIPKAQVDQMSMAVGCELNVLYLAFNLINCRNVSTARAGDIKVRRSGSAKRKREPRLDYHTILLPGMVRGPAGASLTSGSDAVMPLHRVRGHFKTFTEAAPLMGKHTGTYWWGWQVRGNKKNGVIVSDYKVGEPA
ncbi:hypothetical protein FDG57_gp050 [Mycobacterium phage Mutaforma13]|uniref:Uncharacterized protein n=1 Tax=Mycobacterium phage Mutaforma13 TaxID=2922219 RepID=G1DUD8_9CAUD|nr:hypothetical protein FDG57_gp050 [Mycobacterium phage Mutaforma13]AEJ93129.1 hypothetical protein MUTAFORMA13_50 [Mycobacterium phage Mutaforma13]